MTCDKSLQRASYLSVFQFMSTVLCALNLLLPDVVGRRLSMQIATFSVISGIVLSYFVDSFGLKVLLLGISSCSCCTFASIYSIIINETLRKLELTERAAATSKASRCQP